MPIVWTLPPPTQPPPVPRWELISEPVLPVHADQPRPEARPLSAKQFEEIVTEGKLSVMERLFLGRLVFALGDDKEE